MPCSTMRQRHSSSSIKPITDAAHTPTTNRRTKTTAGHLLPQFNKLHNTGHIIEVKQLEMKQKDAKENYEEGKSWKSPRLEKRNHRKTRHRHTGIWQGKLKASKRTKNTHIDQTERQT